MFKRHFLFVSRVVKLFAATRCSIHAAGLTYYSMLALVPILCIVLLAAKSLGAQDFAKSKIHESMERWISKVEKGPEQVEIANVGLPVPIVPQDPEKAEEKRRAAAAFAEQARSVESQILERIDSMEFGALGWIGLAMLVWTVVSSVGVAETSFNEIWSVRSPRPFFKRVSMDLFVAVALPVLGLLSASVPIIKLAKDVIVSTVGKASVTRWLSDGTVWFIDSTASRIAVSLTFASLAFGFIFQMLPCCKVRWRASWLSGLATAIMFSGWVKLCAIAQVGIAKSSALYGSFAFLPIVLAWMYVSWQIILLGCCINKQIQTPAP